MKRPTIKRIEEGVKRMVRITKEDKKDLVVYLEEYLKMFKDDRVHKRAHKKEPCMICRRVEELLKKLKRK